MEELKMNNREREDGVLQCKNHCLPFGESIHASFLGVRAHPAVLNLLPRCCVHTESLTFQDTGLPDQYQFGLYSYPDSTQLHCYWLDSIFISFLLSSNLHSVFLEYFMPSKINGSLYPYPSTKQSWRTNPPTPFFFSAEMRAIVHSGVFK